MAVTWDPRITKQKKLTYTLLLVGQAPLGAALIVLALAIAPRAGERWFVLVAGCAALALALFSAYALDVLRRRRSHTDSR